MTGQVYADSRSAACTDALKALFAQKPLPTGGAVKVYLRNFSSINQTFGYRQGEAVLSQVMQYLWDIEDAKVFRYGSGVSIVALLEGADPARVTAVAQQIVDRFEQPWALGMLECRCAVDIGVVLYPDYANSAQELLAHLDLAVLHSGKTGQNQITVFGPELEERLYRSAIIARLLGSAVENDNIELRYRPTYCGSKKRYNRVECQTRLLTVEFGPVKVAEYGPIAEEIGIATYVNLHVIRRVCTLIRQLLDEGYDFESVSVQVTPVMFVQQSFPDQLEALIREYSIPPKKLGLEVYENPLVSHLSKEVTDRLSGLGAEIIFNSLEFGSASFRDLLTLPIDVLKLKRQFIWLLETNPRSQPVIEGLIHMARGLGVKLVAEGVETDQQNDILNRYVCDYRQGFYYSPTVNVFELKELLAK